jgi:hypothetical protein
VRQGDNVALLQYNGPEMLESMFAFIIANTGAKATILSPEFNQDVLSIRDRIPGGALSWPNIHVRSNTYDSWGKALSGY